MGGWLSPGPAVSRLAKCQPKQAVPAPELLGVRMAGSQVACSRLMAATRGEAMGAVEQDCAADQRQPSLEKLYQ